MTRFGIDVEQWKALTVAGLKHDFRSGGLGSRSGKAPRLPPVAIQLFVHLVFGAFMALAVSWIDDLFVAALLVVGYLMLIIGTAMLVDHNATLTSPTHYAVLAFQPISSRTWFASRLANVLAYTIGMTAAVGLLPVLVLFAKHGLAVGAASVVALIAASTSTSLLLVVAYAGIIRWVGAQRLRGALSYVQLVAGFVVYGGFFLFIEEASESFLSSLAIPKTGWVLAFPGTWFASYIEIAAGRTGITEVLPAVASIALMATIAVMLRGRLALDYARRLSEVSASSAPTRRPAEAAAAPSLRLWFRRGEARAVALLIRAQFRDDVKFRMSVLGVIPLTILYLFMGLRDAADEPAGSTQPAGDLSLVTLAVLLFPAMLKTSLGRSDSFRASWIFFATPADRARLIRSAANVLVAFFLLPYLFFVGVTLLWLTRDLPFVALYLLLAGVLGHLALMIVTLLDPELPFSKPVTKGSSSTVFFVMIIVFAIVGGLLPTLLDAVRGSIQLIAVTVGGLLLASAIVDRMMRARVDRLAARLDFFG